MKSVSQIAISFIIGSQVSVASGLTCDSGKYKVVIDDKSETAVLTHKDEKNIKFKTTKFVKTGKNYPRYSINGTAKVIQNEGSVHEHWYEGDAVIRTRAELVDDDIRYSAQLLTEYDPYHVTASWVKCERK